MNQAIHNGNIPDWKNDKLYFIKNNIYEYKIVNNNYFVYFHNKQLPLNDPNWFPNVPCRFTKKQFNSYFTSMTELRKQKLQKICTLKD